MLITKWLLENFQKLRNYTIYIWISHKQKWNTMKIRKYFDLNGSKIPTLTASLSKQEDTSQVGT